MASTKRIQAPQPFDFDLTVRHQTYYRGRAGADLYAGGAYYRGLRRPGGGAFAARVAPAGEGWLDVSLPAGGSEADLTLAAQAVPQ